MATTAQRLTALETFRDDQQRPWNKATSDRIGALEARLAKLEGASTPTPPVPVEKVARLTSADSKTTFLAKTNDLTIDVIELAAGTYTWQSTNITADRASRPLTIRPVAGATCNFVGPANIDGTIFPMTGAKYVTFDGTPGAIVFRDFAISQAGVFQPSGTQHCTFRALTFQNLRRDTAYSDQPYKTYCFYIYGQKNDDLLIDGCWFKAPALRRDISCLQVASSGTHGSITIQNVREMTGYHYALSVDVPVSNLVLKDWVMTDTGRTAALASIRIFPVIVNGSYSGIKATGCDKLKSESRGVFVNAGGNVGI